MKKLLIGLLALTSMSVFGQTFSTWDLTCSNDQNQKIEERTKELALSEVSQIEIAKNTKCDFKKTQFNSISRVYICENLKVVIKLEQSTKCDANSIKVKKVELRY